MKMKMKLEFRTNSYSNEHLAMAFGRANGLDLVCLSPIENKNHTGRGSNLIKSITVDLLDINTNTTIEVKMRSSDKKNGEIAIQVDQLIADRFIIGKYTDTKNGMITVHTLLLVHFNQSAFQCDSKGYVRLHSMKYLDASLPLVKDSKSLLWQRKIIAVWYDEMVQPLIPMYVQKVMRSFDSALDKGQL